jgi:hypothetical protein
LQKRDLDLPSLISPRQVTITVWELSDTTLYFILVAYENVQQQQCPFAEIQIKPFMIYLQMKFRLSHSIDSPNSPVLFCIVEKKKLYQQELLISVDF